jgi:hypothetical protein
MYARSREVAGMSKSRRRAPTPIVGHRHHQVLAAPPDLDVHG